MLIWEIFKIIVLQIMTDMCYTGLQKCWYFTSFMKWALEIRNKKTIKQTEVALGENNEAKLCLCLFLLV